MGDVVDDAEAHEGLRERKKRRTRLAIHRAALQIASEDGLDHATAEAVAARAGVSTRTFFNYYPSTRDALTGADPAAPARLAARLAGRPTEEALPAALRAVLTEQVLALSADQQDWDLRRALAARSPELTAALLTVSRGVEEALVDAAGRRAGWVGPQPPSVAVMVAVFSALGAVRAAMWQHRACGFGGSIADRLDEAFDALGGQDGR